MILIYNMVPLNTIFHVMQSIYNFFCFSKHFWKHAKVCYLQHYSLTKSFKKDTKLNSRMLVGSIV